MYIDVGDVDAWLGALLGPPSWRRRPPVVVAK